VTTSIIPHTLWQRTLWQRKGFIKRLLKAINLRVRAETLEQAHALVEQRGLDRADLLREALDVGMLIVAASGPPAEHGATDVYGELTGVRLAQRLRPCVATLLDFLSRYDAASIHVLSAPTSASGVSQVTQNARQGHSTIPVDNAVNDALDAFGVEALGNQ
jgi:hypothetical protein